MHPTAQSIDFRNRAAAVKEINAWAAEKTHDRITAIVGEDSISPPTNLIMANAVYFLGKWQSPFQAEKTSKSDFVLPDGNKVEVDMMAGEVPCRYSNVPNMDLQIAELPYRGKTKSLVVLLPSRRTDGLTLLKKDLNAAELEKWLASTRRWDVIVRMPKFSFYTRNDLNDPLIDMGCRRAFAISQADFSDITAGPLAINEVFQLAFVKVDEEGTEAAAVTVGGFGSGAFTKPELIVDRPFLFLIRDVTTGAILFVGQVTDPRSK
jgi:serpin B